MGIYAKFYHHHSPNMVMSRDSGYKFGNFSFSPNSILTLGKVTKFRGNWLNNKNVTDKKQKLAVETSPPRCL